MAVCMATNDYYLISALVTNPTPSSCAPTAPNTLTENQTPDIISVHMELRASENSFILPVHKERKNILRYCIRKCLDSDSHAL